jgi:hypothetical protein
MALTLRRTLAAASAAAVALLAAAVFSLARETAGAGCAEQAALPPSFVSRNISDIFDAPAAPTFQLQHTSGKALLGGAPKSLLLIEKSGYAFAHEAPVWFAECVDATSGRK